MARVEGARSRNLLTMGGYHEAALSAARAIELGGTWAPGTVVADAQITLGAALVLEGDESGLLKVQQARGAGEAGDDYEVTCRSYANQVFLLKYLGRTQAAMDIAAEGLRAL